VNGTNVKIVKEYSVNNWSVLKN